jgi:glutathione S-transferase
MAANYRLCSFKTCPWVQRAAIVLRAKNVPYEIVYIDRHNRPEWFRAISPHSKVPVLQIGEREALFESNAIAEYLDETGAPRRSPSLSRNWTRRSAIGATTVPISTDRNSRSSTPPTRLSSSATPSWTACAGSA